MLGIQSGGPIPTARASEGSLRAAETELPARWAGPPEPTAPPAAPRADPPSLGRPSQELVEERDAWVVLLAVPGLGPVTFTGLLAAFGSARATLAVAAGPNGAARLQEAMADRRSSAKARSTSVVQKQAISRKAPSLGRCGCRTRNQPPLSGTNSTPAPGGRSVRTWPTGSGDKWT